MSNLLWILPFNSTATLLAPTQRLGPLDRHQSRCLQEAQGRAVLASLGPRTADKIGQLPTQFGPNLAPADKGAPPFAGGLGAI